VSEGVFAVCTCNQWRNCGFTGGKIIHTAPRRNDSFHGHDIFIFHSTQKKTSSCNMRSLFTLATSGIFPFFFWLDGLRASSYIVFHHSNLVQMNFPCPLVILRHWRDLGATLKHNKREKRQLHKV
jgi:hypothetical protein